MSENVTKTALVCGVARKGTVILILNLIYPPHREPMNHIDKFIEAIEEKFGYLFPENSSVLVAKLESLRPQAAALIEVGRKQARDAVEKYQQSLLPEHQRHIRINSDVLDVIDSLT